jgi:AcrR family transcriptional regulator
MMSMSIPYEDHGRTNQKLRTRAALVDAARELIARGETPRLEDAAAAASISRATAYRYFANQRELLVAAHPEVAAASLLGDDPPEDPEERLDRVVTELANLLLDAESSYRMMLKLALDGDAGQQELSLRTGRRYPWIEDALEPARARLGARAFARLVRAVSVTAGIEALVTLVDLAGLSREDAVDVMRWSARALLRSALAEREEGARRGS